MHILTVQDPKGFSRQCSIHLHWTLGKGERSGTVLAVMGKKVLWLRSQEPQLDTDFQGNLRQVSFSCWISISSFIKSSRIRLGECFLKYDAQIIISNISWEFRNANSQALS